MTGGPVCFHGWTACAYCGPATPRTAPNPTLCPACGRRLRRISGTTPGPRAVPSVQPPRVPGPAPVQAAPVSADEAAVRALLVMATPFVALGIASVYAPGP